MEGDEAKQPERGEAGGAIHRIGGNGPKRSGGEAPQWGWGGALVVAGTAWPPSAPEFPVMGADFGIKNDGNGECVFFGGGRERKKMNKKWKN